MNSGAESIVCSRAVLVLTLVLLFAWALAAEDPMWDFSHKNVLGHFGKGFSWL